MANPSLLRRRAIISSKFHSPVFTIVGSPVAGTTNSSPASVTKSVTAGNLGILTFGNFQALSTPLITGVSGSSSGTWTKAKQVAQGSLGTAEIWYRSSIPSTASDTLTITLSGATTGNAAEYAYSEFAGQLASGPLDGTPGSATGTSTSPTTGTSSANAGNDLFIGSVITAAGNTLTSISTSGWSFLGSTGQIAAGAYFISTDALTTHAPTWVAATSSTWAGCIASFKHA